MTPQSEQMIRVLKTAIHALGYTYEYVEKRMGVTQGYLSRLFRGVMELRFDHIVQIAEAINLEPEELLQVAFPSTSEPPSEDIRVVVHRLYADRKLKEPKAERAGATATGPSIEEETERIERVVLRTFEKFFSSMAKGASRVD